MGFQQKLVQIEPFLAVEVLREGYAPAHIADGRGEVAPGDAEGVGPASGFGGELRLVHGADGPEQGIQRSAERFLHHPGGERRLQGLRIRTFFRGGGCGPGGFGSPRGLRMYVGGGRFFIREVGEFKAFRLGGKRGVRTTFRKPWKLLPVPTRRRPPCRSWCPVCCGSERGEASGLG